ncbi:MAG: MBL fold metallo-hydrolase [Emcibacter sp.]|nr:MBL fold metallo-hydrolase [Emcibacter sp.]
MTQITPLIHRLVAHNPSPFTFFGTGTYIIGLKPNEGGDRKIGGSSSSEAMSGSSPHKPSEGGDRKIGGSSSSEAMSGSSPHRPKVAIIDPGPLLPSHLHALENMLNHVTISHILITHNHVDHSPAAHPLKVITGAEIYAFDVGAQADMDNHAEEGRDMNFVPDHILKDGDVIKGDGWTLEAVHTPGHLSNHLCFALKEEGALFTGDHVMGWSTSVVSQPDGNMKDYITSLEKLLTRKDKIYYPTHGAPIENPKPYVKALIAHRHERERQILDAIKAGAATIPQMVNMIYCDIPSFLHPAAASSVLSHLIHMQGKGQITCDGKLDQSGIFIVT